MGLSFLDIPFDCIRDHLDEKSIWNLRSTCKQLKNDVDEIYTNCSYNKCKRIVPKGGGRCSRCYWGYRARQFYKCSNEYLTRECRKEVRKYHVYKHYYIDLEKKVFELIREIRKMKIVTYESLVFKRVNELVEIKYNGKDVKKIKVKRIGVTLVPCLLNRWIMMLILSCLRQNTVEFE